MYSPYYKKKKIVWKVRCGQRQYIPNYPSWDFPSLSAFHSCFLKDFFSSQQAMLSPQYTKGLALTGSSNDGELKGRCLFHEENTRSRERKGNPTLSFLPCSCMNLNALPKISEAHLCHHSAELLWVRACVNCLSQCTI